MQDFIVTFPKLNNLSPTFESTCIKLCEEMGEIAQLLGKGRAMNGEQSPILTQEKFANELGSELFDVAQSAMTMLYLLSEEYNFDLNIFYGRHISKLVSKGYLKLGDDFMLDKIYDELGNIVNLAVPDYDIITKEDNLVVIEAKKEAQKLMWDNIYGVDCKEGVDNEVQ